MEDRVLVASEDGIIVGIFDDVNELVDWLVKRKSGVITLETWGRKVLQLNQ